MLDFSTAKENQKLIDVLFNEENTETIELVDSKGRVLKLEQVFAMTMDDRAYCILAPINKVEGLEQGVGLVFKLDNEVLKLEQERETIAKVYHSYYEMYRQSVTESQKDDVA